MRVLLFYAMIVLFLLGPNTGTRATPWRAAQSIELYGTFHAMGAIAAIEAGDDLDQDAVAGIAYRISGSGADFQPGYPLDRVSDSRFVGSLFWLEPGTVYDVRVTFTDPDSGPLDGVSVEAAGTTRAEITIPPPAHSYYVASNGSGTDCSLSTPCSLTEGLSQVEAGQEVVLRGGVYYQGELGLFRSGTAGAPIVIRGYAGETAILDGADPAAFTWTAQGGGVYTTTINVPTPYLVAADGQRLFPYTNLQDLQNLHWSLPGFFADGTTLYVRLADDADPNAAGMAVSRFDQGFYVDDDFIYFVNLTFRHYGRDKYAKAIFFNGASDNLVQGSGFVLNNAGIRIKNQSHRNVVQDNEFYDTIFDWSWDAIKDPNEGAPFLESGAVNVGLDQGVAIGRGNIVRRNTFHDRFDGFQICPASTSGVTNETDVYGNTVYRVGDDGMEADGYCSNVRIWGNTFHDVLTGVSLSPTRTGPVYAIRNVIYNTGAGNNDHSGTAFKFMYPTSSDGAVYLFHNTSDAGLPGTSGLIVGGESGTWETIVARNNIWAGAHYALARYTAAQVVDFDYDDLYTTSADVFVKWVGLPNPWLSTLAELQAQTGQEMNGLSVEPGFVGAASGDYRLNPGSDLVDAGLVIPGINDRGAHAYQGVAPDMGAFEAPQNYFVCDCATDADPGCEPGDDANDGTTTATPWSTVEKARSQFGDLSAAGSIRFCRGGAFDLTSAGDRWINYRCTAANPCTVGDYTPPWASGDEGRPILEKDAGHAFRLGEFGDAVHDEGYVFENLDLRCTACSADNGYGFYLHSDVDDVIIDNVRIDGFDIGVYLGGSSPCSVGDPDCDGHNDRLTLQNCTIRNSRRQGFLGGGDDLAIDNCYFESNGTNPIFDHNIYLSDADIYPGGGAGATGIRITNNELYRSAIDSDGDCSAVSLIGHGNLTDLLIEGNVVREDVSRAKPTCWGIAVDAGYDSPERFENVQIRGNKVINVGSLGIGISACVDCVIENNVVIHEQEHGATAIGVPSKNPGAGDAVTTGTTVRNNSIYVTSPDWGIGIRVDSEGAGHTVVSNAMQYAGASDWWSCLDADLPASSYDAIDYNVCGFPSGIWAEGAATLSDWQALGWGTHSQAVDPGFTRAWDLSPAATDTAIVDAGHPTLSSLTDIYSYPRDSAPDVGAYEWDAGGACYDVTNDNQVTIADVQAVADRWHDPDRYAALYDLVLDGVIDILDVMEMIIHLDGQCVGEWFG